MVFLKLLENIQSKTADILNAKNYDPVQFSVESAKPGFGDYYLQCSISTLKTAQKKPSGNICRTIKDV